MIFDRDDKVIMIGDSITDCGRTKPEGEGLFNPYGNGYVNMVKAFLDAAYPMLAIRIVNKGISGNTVRSLKERWEQDVLAHNPDWLSIMIGINDVWRHFDTPKIKENQVPIDEYESTLEELIEQSKPQLKGLILMTPYFIETNHDDAMWQQMAAYADVVKKLAEKHDAILVDTQLAFDEMLKAIHPMAIAWDRIHPDSSGHACLARAFLKAIDFKF